MLWSLTYNGDTSDLEVRSVESSKWLAGPDGQSLEAIRVTSAGAGRWLVHANGQRKVICGVVHGDHVYLQIDGWNLKVSVIDPRTAAYGLAASEAQGRVETQMPGAIVRILVSVGDEVEVGTPVIVVEAMKMENEFKAPVAGVVSEILVQEGQTVDAGAGLLVIDEASDGA
jgi:3-methylcrotonyl-CoA carboxylase alpha subunit